MQKPTIMLSVLPCIIEVLPRQYAEQSWEIVVFEDPSVNAFALPGVK